MFRHIEITNEEEEETINEICKIIHNRGMSVPAILLAESIKPFTFIGTQMGRFLLFPLTPFMGNDSGISVEKFLMIFEKPYNLEKLVKTLEELTEKEKK